MPPLSNARHEMVAQLVAQGRTKTEAYAMAGYSPDDGNACRLTGKDKMKVRVAEIQQGAAERVQVTVGDLVGAADEIRGLAIRDKQYSAAVGAVKEIGILTGLRIDRREVGKPGEFDRFSDDELEAWIASETAKLVELPDEDVGVSAVSSSAAKNSSRALSMPDPMPTHMQSADQAEAPIDAYAIEQPPTLEDRLRLLGLTAEIKNDVLVVNSSNGLSCAYSARYFVPVVFPGLEDAGISARLIKLGCAEVRINGHCYTVTGTWEPHIDLESPPPRAVGLNGARESEGHRGAGKRHLTKP